MVPILARKNALLLSAILAFAAASLSSSSGSAPLKDLSDVYHLESVRRLLALMKRPDEFRTGETLAAICLLRSYEIISQNVTCQNHLQGSYSLLASHPLELESGLLSAGFWNYLREDITVALIEKRSLMIQLPDEALPTRTESDDDLANRITYLLGRVINRCLLRDAPPLDQSEWNGLRDQFEDWRTSLPSSFEPVLTPQLLPNSGFPIAAAGLQYYHTATIILWLAEPSPSWVNTLQHIERINTLESKLEHHATIVCAFTLSSIIKNKSDLDSCTLTYGTDTADDYYYGYAYEATTTGSNCDTTAEKKTILAAVEKCANQLHAAGALCIPARCIHPTTTTTTATTTTTTTTTTTYNMTIRHIFIDDMAIHDLVINDLLESNIILRNKIANELANMGMTIEEPIINNPANSDIYVKKTVINKLIKMNRILTKLANIITSSKAQSRTTSSAATPSTSSTATSPSQVWSVIPPTETPPSEHEEDEKDPDWPFVGRKGPLPPSPPARQNASTPDEVTEEFLSQTLYPLFGLSRHPNPRGLWTLEQHEKAPIPINLVRNLAVFDKNDPQYLDHEISCKRIKAILNHSYVDELNYRKQNPAKRSSAVLSIPRCRGFEHEAETLGVRFPIEGEHDFVVNNAAEPGNGIGVVICVNPCPATILWQCISFMAHCHNSRKNENKRLTSVYGVATNGNEFYFLEIDDNDMISFHRTILRHDTGAKTNEVYSYFRRFFRDIMDRRITPIPGTQFKPSTSPSRLY
ncbi:hypothetical protein CNMCM6106_009640 [Aspergillus hiratsukae]|uniref:Secreted protein CSS2 C-terminal domain-containing protein n=1 Tax=Aspergillus hiratsukae TaxID=1194566 RepID=A0A8H6UIR4_9EURO|nr:hypothetical protein CNMCM6106_009640 [Aspergillus hiratsukae]